MYHRVLPLERCIAYPLDSLVIPVDAFREQMRLLVSRCRVLPVRDAIVELNRGGLGNRPLVALTFDDGYIDSYEIVAPILEENGLRGTFFITTKFIEEGMPLWYDVAADAWQRISFLDRKSLIDKSQQSPAEPRSIDSRNLNIEMWMSGLKEATPELRIELVHQAESLAGDSIDSNRYRPMSQKQVVELNERRHEIASHTVSHPILTQLNPEELRREINDSAELLSHWTGANIVGFCYPNGNMSDPVECAVTEAGYAYACTTQSGFNKPGVRSTRLTRLSITMQRILSNDYEHDALAFRSELCRLREWWR